MDALSLGRALNFDPDEHTEINGDGSATITVFTNTDLRYVLDMLEELAREMFYHDVDGVLPVEQVMQWNFDPVDEGDINHERLAAWARVRAAADWMDQEFGGSDESRGDLTDEPSAP